MPPPPPARGDVLADAALGGLSERSGAYIKPPSRHLGICRGLLRQETSGKTDPQRPGTDGSARLVGRGKPARSWVGAGRGGAALTAPGGWLLGSVQLQWGWWGEETNAGQEGHDGSLGRGKRSFSGTWEPRILLNPLRLHGLRESRIWPVAEGDKPDVYALLNVEQK